jgi:hypothetical protein
MFDRVSAKMAQFFTTSVIIRRVLLVPGFQYSGPLNIHILAQVTLSFLVAHTFCCHLYIVQLLSS